MIRPMSRVFCALLLIALPCSHVAAGEPLDRIIAVVNDGVVLQSELDQAMELAEQQIRARGLALPPESALRPQVLERLLLVRLQTQRAAQAGIRVDDRELNDVLTGIARQNGMSLAQFAEELRRDGTDFLTVREQVRDEVLITRIRQREVESRVIVTDQDIDLFLSSQPVNPDLEYRLSHILVAIPDGANTEQRAAARKRIDALRKQIVEQGKDFAQVAIASSDGQQALAGGDLDWRRADALPSLFANAAASLAEGEVSAVLEASSGYHLIRLAGVRGGEPRQQVTESRARHLLIQTNAVRSEEQARLLARDLHARLLKGEKIDTLAAQYSDDPGSKNNGGDLGFQPPGVFVPEFQMRIDALKPGELSDPFRSQFGWHIAQLVERRTRDVTVEARRARAQAAIQNRKATEEYEVWLRRLRDEAYIEYRLKADSDAAQG